MRTACPVCGHRSQAPHRHSSDLLVCSKCGETLYRSELVLFRTRFTRRRYARRNGHPLTYGTRRSPI